MRKNELAKAASARRQETTEEKKKPALEVLDSVKRRGQQERCDHEYARQLRSLSRAFPDRHQRLDAIADEVDHYGSHLCSRFIGLYSSVEDGLSWDREEVRSKPKCRTKPVEWHEERLKREREDLKFRFVVPPLAAKAFAAEAIPFAELKSEGQRRACLDELGGEDRVRLVLERFHDATGVSREWLSLHLARQEWLQADGRHVDQQAELQELLNGVRSLAVTVRMLGAPKDVLACLDAWHCRVLAIVLEGDRTPSWYRAELAKRMKKIRDKLGLGPHGVETDAHATRYRYLRRDAERVLVRQLGHMDVAVLETAWLLPVNGEAESEKDIVHEKVAALCPPKDRPTFPVRPELNEDLKPQLNAREARRFFVSLAKALRLDSKASGTPHR